MGSSIEENSAGSNIDTLIDSSSEYITDFTADSTIDFLIDWYLDCSPDFSEIFSLISAVGWTLFSSSSKYLYNQAKYFYLDFLMMNIADFHSEYLFDLLPQLAIRYR